MKKACDMVKKVYEVKFKDGAKCTTMTVKAYSIISAAYMAIGENYNNDMCEKLVSIEEITYERENILNIASAIANADTWLDCEEECIELCRRADMLSEWREAGGDTFESVLNEAAKKLNVKI